MPILRIVRIEEQQETIVASGWDAKEGLKNAHAAMLALAIAEVNAVDELEQWWHTVEVTIEGHNIEVLDTCVRHPGQPHPQRRVHFWLEKLGDKKAEREAKRLGQS